MPVGFTGQAAVSECLPWPYFQGCYSVLIQIFFLPCVGVAFRRRVVHTSVNRLNGPRPNVGHFPSPLPRVNGYPLPHLLPLWKRSLIIPFSALIRSAQMDSTEPEGSCLCASLDRLQTVGICWWGLSPGGLFNLLPIDDVLIGPG